MYERTFPGLYLFLYRNTDLITSARERLNRYVVSLQKKILGVIEGTYITMFNTIKIYEYLESIFTYTHVLSRTIVVQNFKPSDLLDTVPSRWCVLPVRFIRVLGPLGKQRDFLLWFVLFCVVCSVTYLLFFLWMFCILSVLEPFLAPSSIFVLLEMDLLR